MGLLFAGEAGDLTWGARTIGDRLNAADLDGENASIPGRDGALWTPRKTLQELELTVKTFITGADYTGGMPSAAGGRAIVRARYGKLLQVLRNPDALTEIRDDETNRAALVELISGPSPDTMAGGTRAEVEFDLRVPAGCWKDTAAFDTGTVNVANGTVLSLPAGAMGGDLPIVDAVITLTPPASNITITEPGGQSLTFAGALPAGNPTVISCSAWTAIQAGASTDYLPRITWTAAEILPIRSRGSTPPTLTFAMSGTTTATKVRVQGRRRWYTA